MNDQPQQHLAILSLVDTLTNAFDPANIPQAWPCIHPTMRQFIIEKHFSGLTRTEVAELSQPDPTTSPHWPQVAQLAAEFFRFNLPNYTDGWGTYEHPAIIAPDLEEYLVIKPPYPDTIDVDTFVEGYRMTMRFAPELEENPYNWYLAGMKGEILE